MHRELIVRRQFYALLWAAFVVFDGVAAITAQSRNSAMFMAFCCGWMAYALAQEITEARS